MEVAILKNEILKRGYYGLPQWAWEKEFTDAYNAKPELLNEAQPYMKELAFRYDNLMSLCYQCHSDIHKALDSRTRAGHQRASQAAVDRWLARHGETKGQDDQK